MAADPSRESQIERIAAVLEYLTRVEIENDEGEVRVEWRDSEITAEALYLTGLRAPDLNVAIDRSAPEPAEPIDRPEIVCLCGSTRFYDAFQEANYDLTMAGKIVLSVGFYPHSKAEHGHGEGVGHDSTEKVALDELHKRKIDLADRVFVLNVGGYIGESTRGEIDYATAHGKPVDYLEPLAGEPAPWAGHAGRFDD